MSTLSTQNLWLFDKRTLQMCLNEGPGDGAMMLGYLDGLNIHTMGPYKKKWETGESAKS